MTIQQAREGSCDMDLRPTHLALFAGGGGSELAAHLLGWQTVCAVERDLSCVDMLAARQRDTGVRYPIWGDVRTFDGHPWRGTDVVSAGFPCQPFSNAGRQRGEDDDRNLWPETARVIGEVRPTCVLLENVPGLFGSHGYFGRILGDLAALGYDAAWDCIPAAALGAPHRRNRAWIVGCLRWALADARSLGFGPEGAIQAGRHQPERRRALAGILSRRRRLGLRADTSGQRLKVCCPAHDGPRQPDETGDLADRLRADVADTVGDRPQRVDDADAAQGAVERGARTGQWWAIEPGMGRVANGVADRVDRLRALGNGWVPQVVPVAWALLMRRLYDDAE